MKRINVMKTAMVVAVCLLLLTGVSNAREIKGITKSFSPRLAATAVATDGSEFTGKVTVVSKKLMPSGLTLYTGSYSVQVPEGKKVLMLFQKIKADGTLVPTTVARFATSPSATRRTTEFNVTAPLAGGSQAISLGNIRVGSKLATPELNPLFQVDNDGDGISDLEDNDDDNDGIADDQDQDEDGDGVADVDEDQDEDDDGIPDVVDDDDNQGDQAFLIRMDSNAVVFAKAGQIYKVTWS